jgi:hypothetical protein
MSIIALLHNLLKEKLPGIHATRLTALMAAVEAGLNGASISITELGRTLSSPALETSVLLIKFFIESS